jgi:hypothetical protein
MTHGADVEAAVISDTGSTLGGGLRASVRIAVMAGLVVAVVGCKQTVVKGELGGQEVPLVVSMFVEEEAVLGDDGLVTIVLSSIPNACRVYEYFLSEMGQPAWRARSIAWQKAFPEDFWEASIVVRTNDFAGGLSGTSINGLAWDALLEENGQAYSRVVHYTAHPDPVDESKEYFESFVSDAGLLDVTEHDPGLRFKAQFTSSYVDPEDGASKGDLDMKFSATVCPNIAAFGF